MDDFYNQIYGLASQIIEADPNAKTIEANEFDELPSGTIVMSRSDIKLHGQRVKLAKTTEEARPPYEWRLEISIIEGDYMSHYLLKEAGEIFLAERKNLTPASEEEAQMIVKTLQEVKRQIK